MKYNDSIGLLKLFANAIFDSTSITNNYRKSTEFKYPRVPESNNSINNSADNNIYAESKDSNIEYNESVPVNDSNDHNDNNSKNINYINKKLDTSSNPQGVIDSITQELTSVRLQQAIILSEIVGKPRSKTRRKRRSY